MYGVVLWSDARDSKAVIWCEDHGDLAYYRLSEEELPVSLDAGDWVQFDMTMERHMRFAHNPRLVTECGSPMLADALHATVPKEPRPRGSAEIIPFQARQSPKPCNDPERTRHRA